MKPIETIYKGFRFRSRLEARWAVFYDTLRIKWEYEKEGFDLGNGVLYLPDFYIPHLDCWIEIKGQPPNKDEERKISLFCKESGWTLYCFFGQIEIPFDFSFMFNSAYFYHWSKENWQKRSAWSDQQYWWCECKYCGAVGIEFNGRSDRLKCKQNGCKKSEHGDKGYNYSSLKLQNAYLAARQARFEHGE